MREREWGGERRGGQYKRFGLRGVGKAVKKKKRKEKKERKNVPWSAVALGHRWKKGRAGGRRRSKKGVAGPPAGFFRRTTRKVGIFDLETSNRGAAAPERDAQRGRGIWGSREELSFLHHHPTRSCPSTG